MRRTVLALALLLALTITGCGADTGNGDADAMPRSGPTAQGVGGCAADSAAVKQATVVGSFDLDGDGSPERLLMTGPATPCPNTLFAAVGDGYASVPVGDPLEVKSFVGMKLPGHDGAVVRADAVHPRGGFQAHLFGYADGELAELVVDGQPVFGFIATDSESSPVSARCTDTGFEVTTAQPHRPVGEAFSWDLTRTDYTVAGNEVTAAAPAQVENDVSPGQLHRKHRAMLEHSLLANCPAS